MLQQYNDGKILLLETLIWLVQCIRTSVSKTIGQCLTIFVHLVNVKYTRPPCVLSAMLKDSMLEDHPTLPLDMLAAAESHQEVLQHRLSLAHKLQMHKGWWIHKLGTVTQATQFH